VRNILLMEFTSFSCSAWTNKARVFLAKYVCLVRQQIYSICCLGIWGNKNSQCLRLNASFCASQLTLFNYIKVRHACIIFHKKYTLGGTKLPQIPKARMNAEMKKPVQKCEPGIKTRATANATGGAEEENFKLAYRIQILMKF